MTPADVAALEQELIGEILQGVDMADPLAIEAAFRARGVTARAALVEVPCCEPEFEIDIELTELQPLLVARMAERWRRG